MMQYLTPTDYKVAEANGINRKALEVRVYRRKWKITDAISKPLQKSRNLDEYLTDEVLKLLKENKIQITTFKERVTKGWSVERASTEKVIRQPRKRKYSIELIEKAEANGISYSTLIARIGKGWDEEEASTIPPLSKIESARLSTNRRWTEEERKRYFKEYRQNNKAYYQSYYQQNKEKYRQRYLESKIKNLRRNKDEKK